MAQGQFLSLSKCQVTECPDCLKPNIAKVMSTKNLQRVFFPDETTSTPYTNYAFGKKL